MTIATHYIRSNGEQVLIKGMPFPYARSAANILRAGGDPRRADELAALDEYLAELAAGYRAKLEAERETADPERVAKIDDMLAKMDRGQ